VQIEAGCMDQQRFRMQCAEVHGIRGDSSMAILTADMRRVVEQQRLGFVATVCP
jgi:hypothetical protein